MIYTIVTNPIVLMVLCAFATFGLMFAVKHLYLPQTKKIKKFLSQWEQENVKKVRWHVEKL